MLLPSTVHATEVSKNQENLISKDHLQGDWGMNDYKEGFLVLLVEKEAYSCHLLLKQEVPIQELTGKGWKDATENQPHTDKP